MYVKRWKMDDTAIRTALQQGEWGVLSLIDENGEPYGVPLNYVYDDGAHALFMHTRKNGKKIRCLSHTETAHFTIVTYSTVVPSAFVTHYDAVMLSGPIKQVNDPDEMSDAILKLCAQLAPGEVTRRDEVIHREWPALAILRLDIADWSGKCNRDN